jgi:hypothetical protein
MRQLITRLIVIGLLALAAVQLQPSTAHACITFDRAAELALIDDAIASDSASDQLKRLLRTIRRGLTFINELPNPTSNDALEYHKLVTIALESIDKQRIPATGRPNLDIGVFKDNKLPKLTEPGNDPIAIPRC